MRPVRDLVPEALAHVLRHQPLTDAKLQFAWRTTVGPAVARATIVELDARGTLHVRVTSPHWQPEVERAAADLRGRLARLLGDATVRWISVEATRPEQNLLGTPPRSPRPR